MPTYSVCACVYLSDPISAPELLPPGAQLGAWDFIFILFLP